MQTKLPEKVPFAQTLKSLEEIRKKYRYRQKTAIKLVELEMRNPVHIEAHQEASSLTFYSSRMTTDYTFQLQRLKLQSKTIY